MTKTVVWILFFVVVVFLVIKFAPNIAAFIRSLKAGSGGDSGDVVSSTRSIGEWFDLAISQGELGTKGLSAPTGDQAAAIRATF
jgi:hypothetical protein